MFFSKYFSPSLPLSSRRCSLLICMHTLLVNFHKSKVFPKSGSLERKCCHSFFQAYTKAVPLLRRLVAGIVLSCQACPREICCGQSGRVTECLGTSDFLCQCNFNAPYLSSLSWCCYQGKRSEPWSLPTKTSFPEDENGWIVLFALVVW